MTATQPDLFGDLDRAEAEKAHAIKEAERRERIWKSPQTCPSCGNTEPNGFLLRNNHGYHPEQLDRAAFGFPKGQHPTYGDRCTAQVFVTNHITSDARRDNPDQLARSMARGRELNLDVEAIRDAATEHCGPVCPYRNCGDCAWQGGGPPEKES